MTLDSKKTFNVKSALVIVALSLRLLLLLLESIDTYVLSSAPFNLDYFLRQLLAVCIDALIVSALYHTGKILFARMAPTLMLCLLYVIWPFMDSFISGARPALPGIIVLASLASIICSEAHSSIRRVIIIPILIISILAPSLALGACVGSVLFFIHRSKMPVGYQSETSALGILFFFWAVSSFLRVGSPQILVSTSTLLMGLFLLASQVRFAFKKGCGRSAVLTSLVIGSFARLFYINHASSFYILLILSLPSLVAHSERILERWGYSRHFG